MAHYVHTFPKARKPHRCEACGRRIEPGETYLRGVGLDGNAWTWKECAHCRKLIAYLFAHTGEEEYSYNYVRDWDPETVTELRIKVLFKRQWRRSDGTLYPVPVLVEERRNLSKDYDFYVYVVTGIEMP